jgi:hypothetical protein
MKINLKKKIDWLTSFFVFLVFFSTFLFMIKNIETKFLDIKTHNFLLLKYLELERFPFPPGYYFLIYIIDKIIYFKHQFVLSSIFVLSILSWWKYFISLKWIKLTKNLNDSWIYFISITLLFISPIFIPTIDGSFWYLGKFSPTIWHNSTLIAVFPFCLLLVKVTLSWLEGFDNKHLFQIFGLGFIILMIKPSFMFCYIPALPLLAITSRKIQWKLLTRLVGISIFFFTLLYIEKVWIFDLDPMIDKLYSPGQRPGVSINPFHVHLHFSKEPLFDFLSSFPSTILFLFFWGKSAFKDQLYRFSFFLLLFALLVYFIFAETGSREFHGNFYWQIPIALYLHYLSMLLIVFQMLFLNNNLINLKITAFGLVYLIQFVFGLIYWNRLFFELTLI